jgi:hypothetical protein
MSKPREITEAQAWEIVAEEFEAGRTSRYLCFAVGNDGSRFNARVAQIPRELRTKMKRFVRRMVGRERVYAYDDLSSLEQEGRDGRLTALTLFAAMAKDGATNA